MIWYLARQILTDLHTSLVHIEIRVFAVDHPIPEMALTRSAPAVLRIVGREGGMTSVRQPAPARPYDALYGASASLTSRDLFPNRVTPSQPSLTRPLILPNVQTRRPDLHGVRAEGPPPERARRRKGGEGAALR